MPEERITLKYRERGRIVWNREVVYQEYDLMKQKAYILAGNENGWLGYRDEKYFTPDFYIMVTSFDLVSINLLIRYGAEAPKKWSCSGAPLYRCSEDINGIFPTQADCLSACKGAPCSPVWTCQTPANGNESDGCGMTRRNPRCDPIVSVPLSLSADKTTIQLGDLVTFSGKYKTGATVRIKVAGLLGGEIARTTCNSAGDYNVVVYIKQPVGVHAYEAASESIFIPEFSNQVNITITEKSAPCIPKWVCETPLNGYETDGCGHRGLNTSCKPDDPVLPCADGNTRTIPCPDDPTKNIGQICSGGKWTNVSDECGSNGKDVIEGISNETLIIIGVVAIVTLIIILRGRK